MRLTIERLRTVVLAAGVLMVAALVVFLVIGKWKSPFNRRDLPERLGLNIQQLSSDYTYAHALGAHAQFKIHAAKVVQLKQTNHVLLHDVKIELYGEDGSRVDRIEGSEFEYDPNGGIVKAIGEVEITLMRPAVAPAIAPKATPSHAVSEKQKDTALAIAAQNASASAIHVKTSGLTFDRNSGLATTTERVEFSLAQGSGNSIGASYDSQGGLLILDHAVELNTRRGVDVVTVHAQHAEFERDDQVCRLRTAKAEFRGGEATSGAAKILFRPDGSAVRLDATDGFAMATATGGHLTAPAGLLEFNDQNEPRHGHLQGGVLMDSVSEGRSVHGSSPAADLEFTSQGALRHAHLERGVDIASEEQSQSGSESLHERRTWKSPVADLDFRDAGKGKLELNTVHGTQGVLVTGESQRGKGPVLPSKLMADDLTGQFGVGSAMIGMIGLGHASMEETAASGTRQTTQGDRLEAHFVPGSASRSVPSAKLGTNVVPGNSTQIQSATMDGHVVMTQQPVAKPGGQASAMRATSGRAVYEEVGQWLHLTLSPRVEDGGLQLTADKIDVSQASGDAFAHGDVKASWVDAGPANGISKKVGGDKQEKSGKGEAAALGGQGPAHAVSAEAQLHQLTGEATFRGRARLWQGANSVSAPVIVLDRTKQTLVARGNGPAEPVQVVMVSTAGPAPGNGSDKNEARGPAANQALPTVIRVRGGDLKYSDAERKALMRSGALGSVVAETGTATVDSNEVELVLLPPGNHAGKDGEQAQVDRMTARGHVSISSEGRRGTGDQLVYEGENGEYVLTGTGSVPPRLTDPARGTVTGEALIFRSRDDSVSVEAGGRKTMTETTAPK